MILDKTKYNKVMSDLFSDPLTYQILATDPKNRYKTKLESLLSVAHVEAIINDK